MKIQNGKRRRGVVLLLVLSLLVLFSLLALTFLIGATRYRHGAEAFGQHDLRGTPAPKLLDMAVHQLIREPSNPYSSVWTHGFLLDAYGRDGMGGVIGLGAAGASAYTSGSPGTDVATGEILRLDVRHLDFNNTNFDTATFGEPSLADDFYAGSVFSLLDGPGAPGSTRVVRYIAPNSSFRRNINPPPTYVNPVPYASFYVEGFGPDTPTIRDYINSNPNSVRFLVNGKPFNGPGFGYSLEQGGRPEMDWTFGAPPIPVSLQPHYAAYRATVPTWSLPSGDGDESYDAVDYQNMFLARNPPTPDPVNFPIIASFHRPKLIEAASNTPHWSSSASYHSFRRRFIFRPMPWDHPDFTGSNPNLAAATFNGYVYWNGGADGEPGFAGVDDDGDGAVDNYNVDLDGDGTNDYSTEFGAIGSDDLLQNDSQLLAVLMNPGAMINGNTLYDVDNDGDGINDSFWIDLQMPPITSKEGRLYKPLFAFLVTDLDGRLNLNAHGNLAQTQEDYHTGDSSAGAPRPFAGRYGALSWQEAHDLNGDGSFDRPAHGSGVGPAEINPRILLGNNAAGLALYQAILMERYGADNLPGSNTEDFLTFLKAVGRPDDYASATSTTYGSWDYPSAYLSTPDMHGWGAVALLTSGRPAFRYAGRQGNFLDVTNNTIGVASERINHPYEFNLVRPTGDDTPFTPAELEALLRWRDGDAGLLSGRLRTLLVNPPGLTPATNTTPLPELSNLVTTHSSHIPAPPTVPLAPAVGGTDMQLFDILYPTDYILPLDPTTPQLNPLTDNAARIAVRLVDTNSASPTYGQVTGVQGVARSPTLFDLMAAKIVQGYFLQPTPVPLSRSIPADVGTLQNQLNALLPFEIRHGQKMNVNRLWGNGIDDNQPALPYVPAPFPTHTPDKQWFDTAMNQIRWDMDNENIWGGSGAAGSTNYLNDDPVFNGGVFHPRGREMYARHLFCLMMLMVDLDYTPAPTPLGQPQFPGYLEPYVDPTLTTPEMRRELTVRRIAQWAVNCVDFRDADAIMTPFEYDVNPWNGWDVDGDIGTPDLIPDPNNPMGPQIPHPERRVVWGCESPDLLLTETFAFHDRRVKDTKLDTSGNNRASTPDADPTLDQWRIPQGSLFIELYCPQRNFYANATAADYRVAPRELYNVDANGVRLDLARRAPPGTYLDNGNPVVLRYPVWRMAISEAYNRGPNAGMLFGPQQLINAQKRDNISFQPSTPGQPDKMFLTQPTDPTEIPDLPIERVVWFTPQSPAPAMGPQFPAWEQNHVYYNRFGVTELNAGEYLVVGPRAITRTGAQANGDTYPDVMTVDTPSAQSFRLVNDVAMTPTPFFTYTDFGYPRRLGIDAAFGANPAPQVKVARTIVAGAEPPDTWGMVNETANLLAGVPNAPNTPGVGLSISEPLRHQYYNEPTDFLEGSATADYPLRDAFYDVLNGAGSPPDQPFDTDGGHSGYLPIHNDDLARTARYGDYKTVFLQRLANPLLPWHATRNPYITVDWHSIDLTVFNGEDFERPTEPAGEIWDPDDPDNSNQDPSTTPRAPNDPRFVSRERIGQRVQDVNYGLFNTNTRAFDQAEDDPRSADYFSLNARHSLGYLSRQIDGVTPAQQGHPNPAMAGMTPVDDDDFVTTRSTSPQLAIRTCRSSGSPGTTGRTSATWS
jgi:hypothetical protein